MIYNMTIDTPSYMCDVDDRLHTWAAVRLCQEVTEYHGNATGIGFKTLVQQNRAWVITRALYNIYRLPNAFEKISLDTWSRNNNGLIAYRDYRVTNADGEVLLTGTSAWPMIDMTTRRVLRLNDIIANYENHAECATQFESLPKLKMPAPESMQHVAQRTVSYAMLDHTQHMNNSEYIKLIFDCLNAVGFKSDKPFVLDIGYQHESRLGEQLDILQAIDADPFCYEITNPRGISVSARIYPL